MESDSSKFTEHGVLTLSQDELEKFVALAQYDPGAADQLFHLLLFGRRNPKIVKEVQNLLSNVGVPVEWCHIKEILPFTHHT